VVPSPMADVSAAAPGNGNGGATPVETVAASGGNGNGRITLTDLRVAS